MSKSDRNKTLWESLGEIVAAPVARTILIYGPPGCGKTYLAQNIGLRGRPLYSVTLSADTPSAEARGHFLPCGGGQFRWHDGPALRAWREGGRLVLNEIDHAGADVMSFLHNCLDSKDSARLTLPTGETVTPHHDFQCIATMNTDPTETLPEALKERFMVCIGLNDVCPEAIDALPEDLRLAAQGTATASDPQRKIPLRAWQAFATLRTAVGAEKAAAAVFGARASAVLDSLCIAAG